MRFSSSVFWRLFAPTAGFLVLFAIIAAIGLPWLILRNAERDAVASAEDTVRQFKSLRQYYTENVVSKALAKDVKVSFDHQGHADTIPLPATMIHDLSEAFRKEGVSIKLYSPLPFPNRKDRVTDRFGNDAWQFLQANPDKTFSRVEQVEGKSIVRVAVADKMAAEACVSCHNTHPLSPKKDWKLGDVRGILEVNADKQLASGTQISWMVLAGLALLIVAIAACLRIVYQRSIAAPLAQVVAAAEKIAAGDLSVQAGTRRSDEFGVLLDAIRTTAARLGHIVGGIKGASDSVSVAASEIAQGHLDLSARTEEEASSLAQTAATMEQMTATLAQNAQSAREANNLAHEASTAAQSGGNAVGAAVTSMADITNASRRIADIIGVIDGIAFQTNILALNAAVEAARAGDSGRGFSVVAAEVRTLAQRSAAAAKEIRDLITTSVQRIETGSAHVNEAGQAMNGIVSGVMRLSGLIAEISAAVQEQSQSINQVGTTVVQLETMMQKNASMVEEASAASASLEHQASLLRTAVAGFKLEGENEKDPGTAAGSSVLAVEREARPLPRIAARLRSS